MGDFVTITVRVVPRASRSEVIGLVESVLKLRLAAPPVDGAANAELVKLLAKTFGISRTRVEIAGGEASRNKRIRLHSIDQDSVDAVLKGFS